MKGSHNIIVETEHSKYSFTIRRNITVLLGDSATGKTTLVDYLNMYSMRGTGSGVSVQSDVPCVVFNAVSAYWRAALTGINSSIIFIDEGQPFIFSKDFAESVQKSDNYYVLITRRPLYNLPYSTKEIYGIRTVGKYHFPEKVYHEFYPIYDSDPASSLSSDSVLLTEDSNAGFDFFRKAFPDIRCISAGGNSRIASVLNDMDKSNQTIVLADGAAFGAYIENILSLREIKKNVSLYLPESFEWLILRSGVINNADIPDILEHPEDFIDSAIYLSWERFFTGLLEKVTADNEKIRYSKTKLAEYYLSARSIKQILDVMPDSLRSILKTGAPKQES